MYCHTYHLLLYFDKAPAILYNNNDDKRLIAPVGAAIVINLYSL